MSSFFSLFFNRFRPVNWLWFYMPADCFTMKKIYTFCFFERELERWHSSTFGHLSLIEGIWLIITVCCCVYLLLWCAQLTWGHLETTKQEFPNSAAATSSWELNDCDRSYYLKGAHLLSYQKNHLNVNFFSYITEKIHCPNTIYYITYICILVLFFFICIIVCSDVKYDTEFLIFF